MASLSDPTVAWVCCRLKDSGDEGIPVSQLIEQFNVTFPDLKADDSPNIIWEVITGRENISVGDDGAGIDWKKLKLKEVLLLEQIGRNVKVKAIGESAHQETERADSTIEIAQNELSPANDHIQDAKELQDGIESSIVVDDGSSVGQDNAEERVLIKTPEQNIQRSSSLQSQSTPQSTSNGRRSSITQNGVDDGMISGISHTHALSRPQTPQFRHDSVKSSPPKLVEESSVGLTLKKSSNTRYHELQKKDDEKQREAGVSRVYINPAGSARPRPPKVRGRPRTSCIAVFKSGKLKDPQWLDNHKDSWVDILAAKQKANLSSIDDNSALEPPSKRLKTSTLVPNTQQEITGGSVATSQAFSLPQDSAGLSVISPAARTNGNGVTLHISQAPNTLTQPIYQSPYAPKTQSIKVPSPTRPREPLYRSPYATPSRTQHVESKPQTNTYKSIYPPTTQPSTQLKPTFPTTVPPKQYKSPYRTASSPTNTYTSPYQMQTSPQRPYMSPFTAPSSSSASHDLNSVPKTHVSPYGPAPTVNIPPDMNSHIASSIVNLRTHSTQKQPRSHISPYKPLTTTSMTQNSQSAIGVSQILSAEQSSKKVDLLTKGTLPETDAVPENGPSSTSGTPVVNRRKRGRPRRVPIELSPEDIKLRECIAAAETVAIPSCTARLSAIWNDLTGNLVLSEDKSTLSFHVFDQTDLDGPPAFTINVKQMTKNPVTSVPGSQPMELLIFAKDENDCDLTHRFKFLSADNSSQDANNMRAKLVTAMIMTDLKESSDEEDEDGNVQLEAEKPFVCEICGNRWKNKEGILYHKTKSNTTCNPSFNPAEYTREHWSTRKKRKLEHSAVVDDGLLDDAEDIVEEASPDLQAIASIEDVEESTTEPGIRRQPRRAAREAARRLLKKKIIPAETKASKGVQETGSSIQISHQDQAYVSPYVSFQHGSHGLNAILGEQDSDDSYEEEKPKRKRRTKAKSLRSETPFGAVDNYALLSHTWSSLERPSSVSSIELSTRANEPRTPKKSRGPKTARTGFYSWSTAPTFLQNPQTGAWNQIPLRPRAPVKRKIRLPEPITFMQSEDSTWSVRPYGHGVWPIYARPSRRIEGHPSLANYLEKIGNSHRPVLMPGRGTPFPTIPSQQLLWQAGGASSPSSPGPRDSNQAVNVKRVAERSRASRLGNVTAGRQRKGRTAASDIQASMLSFLPRSGGPLNPGLETLPSSFGLDLSRIAPNNPSSAVNSAQIAINEKLDQSNGKRQEIISDLNWLFNNPSDAFSVKDILSKIENGAVNETERSQSPWDVFQLEVDAIAEWEQTKARSLLDFRSSAPNYKWIYHGIDHSSAPALANLQWEDQNAFTVLTLPYDELDIIATTTIPEELPGQRQRGNAAPAIIDHPAEPRKYQRFHTTRYQTAIASDFEGILATPETAAAEVGVELMPVVQHQPRKRTLDGTMPPEMETRLIVAAVVLRTLTGGLDSQIDWVLLEMVLPQYSMHWLRKKWLQISDKKKVMIENVRSEFQEVFLEGYEAGEIPHIDYDHLINYDWNWLVDWTLQRVNTSSEEIKAKKSKAISLPSSRSLLEQQFTITRTGTSSSSWRDTYFGLLPPVYKRMELASSVPYTTPLKPLVQTDEIDDITLVKSWTRATCFTPDASWDPSIAAAKLKSVPASVTEKALESLLSSKVLMHKSKGRAVPGRPYDATELFYTSLRKHITESMFVEAAAYKSFLDESFRSGYDCIRFDYFANEGTVMCVTNLQAQGRIRLVGVGIPNDRFGLTDGGYETRKLDKAKYRFDMDIYPTDSYMFDSDNPVLKKLDESPNPMAGKKGELPLWLDIQGKRIDSLWKKTITGVFGIVSLRAGIDIPGLAKVFSPALESWEIRRLMDWAVEIGALAKVMQDIDGWSTGEWWWLVAGKICSA
ncbi:hypothetical protein B7463_g8260, partial [Scytalidium lignicola]